MLEAIIVLEVISLVFVAMLLMLMGMLLAVNVSAGRKAKAKISGSDNATVLPTDKESKY